MKKAISVFAIAILFISMLSPIVRADITLTSEFVEPVKNWSFEYGDGAPWSTNNGGWREPNADINRDGTVDILDKWILDANWGPLFTPENPDYNPNADINRDGKVSLADKAILYQNFGEPTKCIHGSYSWYTSGGGDYYMWQFLDSDTIDAVKGKQVAFTFWFLPESVASDGSENYARAEIYYEYASGSNTVYGDWVHPNETKWYNVFVTASLSSTTSAIKVIIHGKPDFKAYVDLSSFSICDYATASSDEGNLALAVNLFRWRIEDVEPGFPDGLTRVSAGLYAERAGDRCIRAIELKVELLPNDGSESTQQGGLQIWYCGQANEDGYEVDPAATEEFQNQVFSSSTFATKVIAGVIVGYYVTFPYSLIVTTLIGGVTHFVLPHFASDPNDPTASAHLDPTDYFILERWDYPTTRLNTWEFVASASGHYGFEWQFHTESDSDFQIRVTAGVNWGSPYYEPDFGYWWLLDIGWTYTSTTITINA